jgi:hypothetical protein
MVTKIPWITSKPVRIEYALLSIIITTTLNCYNIIGCPSEQGLLGKLTANQEKLLKNFTPLCLRKDLNI